MSKPFDMELFLAAVLTGSYATRQRHLRQAKIIQAEISERWQLETPWAWRRKHLTWFLEHRLAGRGAATRYYYLLTVRLLVRRLEKPWGFEHQARI
ncbi:hypothetical protein [Pseudomonas sp. UBA4617]|uniref:hypothetical protein n=1 Tax=Pseudomonas sp. UBA4617 TaxID=1947318 RepID=UPI0025EA221B|nr:hypothetical protein [Pseudomonas sp. UBA4617]